MKVNFENIVFTILQNLMVKDTLNTIPKLQKALKIAEAYVSAHHKDTPYKKFENRSISNSFSLWLYFGNNEQNTSKKDLKNANTLKIILKIIIH
jgi:hypothetical protein